MKVLALLLGCSLALGASAAELFSSPAGIAQLDARLQPLRDVAALGGRFSQERYIAGIARPLRSSGEFLYVAGRGIRWHTLAPFDSDFVLTPDGMSVREGGRVALELQPGQQPGLRLVSDIFLALFALDFKLLGRHFDLFLLDLPAWQVGLVPRDAAFRALATRITIAGNARIDRVVLEDAHGDRTVISFADIRNLSSVAAKDLEPFGR